jgi:hypothetical protein
VTVTEIDALRQQYTEADADWEALRKLTERALTRRTEAFNALIAAQIAPDCLHEWHLEAGGPVQVCARCGADGRE